MGIDAEEVKDLFLLVPAVTAGVDADGGELAALAPAFDGEGRDSEEVGDFADGKKVR